ncbi:putative zinc transport system zinc-binding lipoprotein adcA [groundwater metagenome]|uniref:Putative zinc transport system zinc-binding lipoprotein adcA n=1 Tax=groundwater metagenome TaxID=717931 RepID=A0A098EDG6_9ZZZZ
MEQKNLLKGYELLGIAAVGAILILGVLISGCIEEKPKENLTENLTEKIIVGVTILPQVEFVEKVGGDKVKVMVMIPPGASPHTYEPTPNQMIDLSNAKMYAKIGTSIEFELGSMDKIANLNKNLLIVDCSKGIELKEMSKKEKKADAAADNVKDPHIWLSARNAKIMVENIYEGLVKVDPANKGYYKKNKDSYIAELDKVDTEISRKLSNLNNRKILVYHPAWGYFCSDYNLTQIAIEKEGKEPTPQGIENLIKQAKENNITIIFASPQFSTKSAEVVAKEINGKVVLINPLPKKYTENLYNVADALSGI